MIKESDLDMEVRDGVGNGQESPSRDGDIQAGH